MTHVTPISAAYCKHGEVAYDEVHLVTLTVAQAKAEPVTIYVTHRGTGLNDELWFDFTYPDGASPMSETLARGVDNSFVLMPGQIMAINPGHKVWQVSLTSNGNVPYSVTTMW